MARHAIWRLVGWLIVIALLALFIKNPVQFSDGLKATVQWLETAIVAIAQFAQSLTK